MHVKIGDFGVAALTSFPPAIERVGTVTYHAPEVSAALLYSAKSDVWSIGCIMWEVMTIRPPGASFCALLRLLGAGAISSAQSHSNSVRKLFLHIRTNYCSSG